MMKRVSLVLLCLTSLGVGFAPDVQAQDLRAQRPLRVQDLFELEQIGAYPTGNCAFAADGDAFAFTRVRPARTLGNHKWDFLWGNAGSDVWLHPAPGTEAINLTQGESDGSGWWAPAWSPDGKHLAMLSTRGGNVRLWVWSRKTGQFRQLTSQGVELTAGNVFAWTDERHIVCQLLPADEQPLMMRIEVDTPRRAAAVWPKAPEGREVTASVLDSGVPVDLSQRPQNQLVVIDVATAKSRVLLEGTVDQWRLAPGGRAVAYTRKITAYTPKSGEELRFDSMMGKFTVGVVDLEGRKLLPEEQTSQDVLTQSLRWSPDGRALVFLGFGDSREEAPKLYWFERRTDEVVSLQLEGLDAAPIIRRQPQLEWTADGQVLVLAAALVGGKRPPVTARRDWYLVQRDGRYERIGASLKSVPQELVAETGRRTFVGLADGELWRITPRSGTVQNLTKDFEPQVRQLVWPLAGDRGDTEVLPPGRTYDRIILATWEGFDPADYHLLDLQSGTISPLRKPAPDVRLMAYSPVSTSAVFAEEGRNGTFIRRTTSGRPGAEELMLANAFLQDVAEGEFRMIDYRSLNGEPLKARLILPVGYETGRKYPLLTWVYAGSMVREGPVPASHRIGSSHPLNMQIPAAHGYAVLMPSMPLKPEGQADDPMLRLPDGVLPAVEKVIELGIADPERLFVAGQSFGGYSTYGLVTQTRRFNAAVALAGLSNLTSLYGVFDARVRYSDYPHEILFSVTLSESGQLRMGGAPWEDAGRYLRNSPIFYVDRVETPLMIIQGDLDYVAMQQGEEFFMSLYRQGKRAQFVRYWGEGHVLRSPANIVDMWQRIFAWFEEFGPGK